MNLIYSERRDIESAYIIRIPYNDVSDELSARCKRTCDSVGMPTKFWDAFDGTDGRNIRIPSHAKDKDHFSWIKLHSDSLTTSQIACLLSHYSLWCHCLTIDQPIVILEHDAIVVKKLERFELYNSIQFLGSIEQCAIDVPGARNWKINTIPPFATSNSERLKFICRAHAYAVDPAVCKNLISRLIANGIDVNTTADAFIRSDIFNISQIGLYAYDLAYQSTVKEINVCK